MTNQRTVRDSVKVDGINIYPISGRNSATFHPAQDNSGLTFIVNGSRVPVSLESAENERKAISISSEKSKVYLVEHLLSAVYALGIDNLDIELSNNVCPTTNNCAREYFEALKPLIVSQTKPKKFWSYLSTHPQIISSPFEYKNDELEIRQANGFKIDYTFSKPHKSLGRQHLVFDVNNGDYFNQIANARSPVILPESAPNLFLLLGSLGKLHGVNEKNHLLVKSKEHTEFSNPVELGDRYEGTEVVRHKILDVMGTLALTGRHFSNTQFDFRMTGHRFDLYALKKLFNEGYFSTRS